MPGTTTLHPPEGWRLVTSPTLARAGRVEANTDTPLARDNIEARLTGLRDWATANGLKLTAVDYSLVSYEEYLDIYCWTSFQVRYDAINAAAHNESIIGTYPCTGCANTLRVGQVYCDRCDRFIVCDDCHLAGLKLYGTPGQATAGVCPVCSVECATVGCLNRLATNDGYTKCPTCEPRAACGHCGQLAPLAQLEAHTYNGAAYSVCPKCVTFVCAECETHSNGVQDRRILDKTLHICEGCAEKHYAKERAKFEIWDTTEMPVSGSLLIPSTAARPVRTVSIETEFDGDGLAVGKALCAAGLLPTPERIGRHREQGDEKGRFPCLLKSDGSVTGGELVTYLMDLDHDNHASAILRMTEVMRGMRETGKAQFTHRAGGHIHIDLHGLTARDLWVKYTLFKYCELPIFVLAGAGADYGHRTLQGSGYTNPGPNGPFNTVGGFATKVLRGGDRWALHFGNFTYAKDNCKCGAYVVGEWQNCTCNLGKATAEWRVFNSEITPRILHGWLALMQAMTAYATDLETFSEADYPALLWNTQRFSANTATTKAATKERLEWMHRELPLTLHERDSLIYACKRSQLLDLGGDYLDSLLNIEPNNAFGAKKAARNPGSRKEVAFALAAVEGNIDARYVDDFYNDEDVEFDDFDDDDEF